MTIYHTGLLLPSIPLLIHIYCNFEAFIPFAKDVNLSRRASGLATLTYLNHLDCVNSLRSCRLLSRSSTDQDSRRPFALNSYIAVSLLCSTQASLSVSWNFIDHVQIETVCAATTSSLSIKLKVFPFSVTNEFSNLYSASILERISAHVERSLTSQP